MSRALRKRKQVEYVYKNGADISGHDTPEKEQMDLLKSTKTVDNYSTVSDENVPPISSTGTNPISKKKSKANSISVLNEIDCKVALPETKLTNSESMFELLQKQKNSYEELWNRYISLEQEMKNRDQLVQKQLSKQKLEQELVAQQAIDFWKNRCQQFESQKGSAELSEEQKARFEELKKMCSNYKEKADSLHQHATVAKQESETSKKELSKLQSSHNEAQELLSLYRKLTGIEMSRTCQSDKAVVCTVQNVSDKRGLVFSLSSVEEEQENQIVDLRFCPLKVNTNHSSLPSWISDTHTEGIEFSSVKAPLLTKRILEAVFAPRERPSSNALANSDTKSAIPTAPKMAEPVLSKLSHPLVTTSESGTLPLPLQISEQAVSEAPVTAPSEAPVTAPSKIPVFNPGRRRNSLSYTSEYIA